MSQGKLEIVKLTLEMNRMKIDILGIGEFRCAGAGSFTSENYEVSYFGNEGIKKNEGCLVSDKKSIESVIGHYPKNDGFLLFVFKDDRRV